MNDEPTIYVVDDEPSAMRALTDLVKVLYPRVKAFTSAAEFLRAYRAGRPGCLVLDVAMPGMNGLELHRKLIHDKISLPVIYVTGHGNITMAVEAMQMGAVNFLEKPIQKQQLWDNIRKALEIDVQAQHRRRRRQRVEERLAQLTVGEREVLHLILEGKRNKEIAAELHLSMRTIEDRRAKIMKKMGAASLAELVQLVTMH